ncbi:MAG: hypothetical protein FJY76_01590 [Candidatus Aenigmarchaeota archaeon]|nr:hypothetical protein [Candidatus Aenigmarchaeota archaeon]
MFAIVHRDMTGYFTLYSDRFEVSPHAQGVVAIYRGPLDKIRREAEDFERCSRGNYVRCLSPEEILRFLSQEEVQDLTP